MKLTLCRAEKVELKPPSFAKVAHIRVAKLAVARRGAHRAGAVLAVLVLIAAPCFAKKDKKSKKDKKGKEAETAPAPSWVVDAEKDFPRQQYFSYLSSAKTADDARDGALAGVASFFKAQVTKYSQSLYTATHTDAGTVTTTQTAQSIESHTLTSVDAVLRATETTQPYFSKGEGTWYCLGYFDRNKAYAIYGGEADAVRTKFREPFDAAERGSDMFQKIRLYNAASVFTEELESKVVIAECVAPDSMLDLYTKDIRDAASIVHKIRTLQNDNPVAVTVDKDDKNVIAQAAAACLQGAGFKVASGGKYTVRVDFPLDIIEEESDGMTMYIAKNAVATVTFIGIAGEEHTFTAQAGGKVSSYKRDKVVSRVCQNIASDIAAGLPKDVDAWLGMRRGGKMMGREGTIHAPLTESGGRRNG